MHGRAHQEVVLLVVQGEHGVAREDRLLGLLVQVGALVGVRGAGRLLEQGVERGVVELGQVREVAGRCGFESRQPSCKLKQSRSSGRIVLVPALPCRLRTSRNALQIPSTASHDGQVELVDDDGELVAQLD